MFSIASGVVEVSEAAVMEMPEQLELQPTATT